MTKVTPLHDSMTAVISKRGQNCANTFNDMDHAEIVAALGASPAFKGVAGAPLRELAARSRAISLPAGAFVFDRNHRSENCWLVISGLLQITSATPRGRQIAIDLAAPGDFFGCLAGAHPEPYASDAAALVDSRLAEIPWKAYEELLDSNQAFRENILKLLGRRLRESQQMRALTVEPAKVRVLWALLLLRRRLGEKIPLTRRVLADIAGIAPETCIRVLSPLEKAKVIRTQAGTLHIARPERLEALLKSYERRS